MLTEKTYIDYRQRPGGPRNSEWVGSREALSDFWLRAHIAARNGQPWTIIGYRPATPAEQQRRGAVRI